MARLKGIYDFTWQPLYDTVTLTTGVLPTVTFFQFPIGQGVSCFGGATLQKGKQDTNMTLGGQLPTGYGHLVMGLRVAFPWNILDADIKTILNGCFFEFSVATKPFLTIPATSIPAGNGPFGTGSSMNNNGWPSTNNGFGLHDDPIPLESGGNFQVTLNWPGTAPSFTTTGFQPTPGVPCRIYLDGRHGRPVQ